MPSSSPVPFLMARVMLSAGMLTSLASSMACLSRKLAAGSPPPMRAATVISLTTLVKTAPFLASAAPLVRLMVDHLLWPLMLCSLRAPSIPQSSRVPVVRVSHTADSRHCESAANLAEGWVPARLCRDGGGGRVTSPLLKSAIAIDQDGHWAIDLCVHLHGCAEAALLHGQPLGREHLAKALVQRVGRIWCLGHV